VLSSREPGPVRRAAWLRAFDFWGQLEVVDVAAPARPAPVALPEAVPGRLLLVDEQGETHAGFAVLEQAARKLPILAPLALLLRVPGVAAVGRALWPKGDPAEKPVGTGAA
jgi:hypothetical protein